MRGDNINWSIPFIARPILSGQTYAVSQVARAVRRKELIHPSMTSCVDCGAVAAQYDHRDYNFPLLVVPVCRSCNINRGQAIPKHGFFEKMVSLTHAPYEYRIHMERLAKLFCYQIEGIDSLPYRVTIKDWIDLWPGLEQWKSEQYIKQNMHWATAKRFIKQMAND